MQGVRVLEVAQFTFVPAAGGVLTDWGADVVKIEHPERGDAQRGLVHLQNLAVNPLRATHMQHPNRGKRSVGLDISRAEGRELLYKLAAQSDVFLTNYLPTARRKLGIDVEDIRRHNPKIIYVRGTALGDKGPEREKGGFDSTAFWARGGSASLVTPKELEGPLTQPGPAYGDTIGGMNIAGGIAAALFHRERTGEPSEVDVSLLSSGVWATAASIDVCLDINQVPFHNPMPGTPRHGANPLTGVFRTADGRYLNMTVLVPDRYLRDTFEHLGIGELADDPRFSTGGALLANAEAARRQVADAFARETLAHWREKLKTFSGQWAAYQTPLEVGSDAQVVANGMIYEVEAADGGPPMRLVASPVQFDRKAIENVRAPEAAEHTEAVLEELGLGWDRIIELKDMGVVS